ncbi:MAG: hypothetical protein IVW57_18655 [Ktedonobacterales bacterium]|nr:hypothetical protein [Ktedonobacterales bacterium]
MGPLSPQFIGTAIALLAPAVVGVHTGSGGARAATRVRALGASALLLLLAGMITLAIATIAGGQGAVLLTYLALWLGVIPGVLLAAMSCAAGLAHAARGHHRWWRRILLAGSLVPLLLSALLIGVALVSLDGATTVVPAGEVAALFVALVLAALSPLAALAYGLWAVQHTAGQAYDLS